MAAMKLDNICYQYKKTNQQVLKGVSCEFEGGELSSVIGPSGSGKTTLLSIMAGLDVPTQGDVSVEGESLAKMDLDLYRRKRIAMIFQSFQLFPLLTVLENVCYPMELNGAAKKAAVKRAAELLELMGITAEKHKRYPIREPATPKTTPSRQPHSPKWVMPVTAPKAAGRKMWWVPGTPVPATVNTRVMAAKPKQNTG